MCKFVKTGIMHNTFSGALRPDGKGIDMMQFGDFDVANAIEVELDRMRTGIALCTHTHKDTPPAARSLRHSVHP